MYPSIGVAPVVQSISGLNYFRKGMPKMPSPSQSKTSNLVFLNTLVPSYNSTYTYPQVLTSEPSANLTLTTKLCFTLNPYLLQITIDKKLFNNPLSIKSAYKCFYTLFYNLISLEDMAIVITFEVDVKTIAFPHSSCP